MNESISDGPLFQFRISNCNSSSDFATGIMADDGFNFSGASMAFVAPRWDAMSASVIMMRTLAMEFARIQGTSVAYIVPCYTEAEDEHATLHGVTLLACSSRESQRDNFDKISKKDFIKDGYTHIFASFAGAYEAMALSLAMKSASVPPDQMPKLILCMASMSDDDDYKINTYAHGSHHCSRIFAFGSKCMPDMIIGHRATLNIYIDALSKITTSKTPVQCEMISYVPAWTMGVTELRDIAHSHPRITYYRESGMLGQIDGRHVNALGELVDEQTPHSMSIRLLPSSFSTHGTLSLSEFMSVMADTDIFVTNVNLTGRIPHAVMALGIPVVVANDTSVHFTANIHGLWQSVVVDGAHVDSWKAFEIERSSGLQDIVQRLFTRLGSSGGSSPLSRMFTMRSLWHGLCNAARQRYETVDLPRLFQSVQQLGGGFIPSPSTGSSSSSSSSSSSGSIVMSIANSSSGSASCPTCAVRDKTVDLICSKLDDSAVVDPGSLGAAAELSNAKRKIRDRMTSITMAETKRLCKEMPLPSSPELDDLFANAMDSTGEMRIKLLEELIPRIETWRSKITTRLDDAKERRMEIARLYDDACAKLDAAWTDIYGDDDTSIARRMISLDTEIAVLEEEERLGHHASMDSAKTALETAQIELAQVRSVADEETRLKQFNDLLECPICEDRRKTHAIVGCGHMYCPECIEQLPKKICPKCRAEFTSTTRVFI